MTHFVNLWPLAFQAEWAMCCLPADISGNLESRSKLLYASLTFLHNAQWGLGFSAQNVHICFTVPTGLPFTIYMQIFTEDPTTGPLEITSLRFQFSGGFLVWIQTSADLILVGSLRLQRTEREPSGVRGSAHFAPRNLPYTYFPLEMHFENHTGERMPYLDSHVC